jgi:hypothetical protein
LFQPSANLAGPPHIPKTLSEKEERGYQQQQPERTADRRIQDTKKNGGKEKTITYENTRHAIAGQNVRVIVICAGQVTT